VSLSRPAAKAVSVIYATAPGTAVPGPDFVAKLGTLTIPAGAVAGVVSVEVKGDRQVEPNEAFTVKLLAPTGASLGRGTGTGTIVSDDGPSNPAVRAPIGNAKLVEGTSGARALRFPVTLSASRRTVKVHFRATWHRDRRRLRRQGGDRDHAARGRPPASTSLSGRLRPRAHRDVHRDAVAARRGHAQPGDRYGAIFTTADVGHDLSVSFEIDAGPRPDVPVHVGGVGGA
jgi:hypothetical protein